MRKKFSQVQPVYPNEKDIQAEHRAKGSPESAESSPVDETRKVDDKRKEHPENHEIVNPKRVNYNE